MAPFAFASILRLLNSVMMRLHPGRAALLRALSVTACCLAACSGHGAAEAAVASSPPIQELAERDWLFKELSAERDRLLQEVELLRQSDILASKAIDVLGCGHRHNLLDGIGGRRSPECFNKMLIAGAIHYGPLEKGEVRWETHCPILLKRPRSRTEPV